MTHANPRSLAPLRDVLYEFSLAQEIPDAELLDDFIRRYPEHAAPLTEFAVELAVDALRPRIVEAPADVATLSPAVSRAMSKFQNAIHAIRAGKMVSPEQSTTREMSAENPFRKYDRQGLRGLASALNATVLFVCRLRDREIDPVTIKEGFRRFLAEKMLVPLEVISDHLAGPRGMIPQAQFHKADQKPEMGKQQSFEEAVRNSGLTEEQQRFLLSL